MTDYGKKKCELLEQKGFKANDIVYWVAHENEDVRLYYYVKKRMGAEVQTLCIGIKDDLAKINDKYQKIQDSLAEYKDYLKTECGSADKIPYCDAETSNTFDYVGDLAHEIDELNRDVYDIECGLPWSEVSDIFECDDCDNWVLKDDPELFGEEN